MDEPSDVSPALKAFSVLELIAGLPYAPTLAELTETAGLPKPTLHRWLNMLEGAELVRRMPDGRRYELAARATRLAVAVLANSSGSLQRRRILQQVADELGESCNLTILQGGEVIYLERVETALPLRVAFQKGSRVPAHCSASGKLFLAMMPRAKRERLLSTLSLERFTPNTLVDAAALGAELERIRREGYAFDDEEYFCGLFCVAVPILDGKGQDCLAALALQAPVIRLSRRNAVERLPTLRAAAKALGATLA